MLNTWSSVETNPQKCYKNPLKVVTLIKGFLKKKNTSKFISATPE